MKKIYNVALIGCGNIANNHLNALRKLDFVNVVAICDIKAERAEAKRAENSLSCKTYTDYIEMLDTERIDSVHICTPHYLHAPMAIEALSRNINVFLEKPVCISQEQLSSLKEAEKNSSGKVMVCFQNRFNPSTVFAKKIIEEDGGVESAYATVIWNRNERYYTGSGWRGAYSTEGGGVMINQAIHTLDLLCEFIGTPDTVTATIANHHLKGIIEVEDMCEGIIKFANGKTANFYTTTSFSGADNTTVYLKTKNHTLELMHSKLFVDGEIFEDPSFDTGYVGKECYGNGHVTAIKIFYEALENDSEIPITVESAEYALRILLAAYKSNDAETKI